MKARAEVIRLSIYTFLHFTPASSLLTIVTAIFQDQQNPGVGPASLMCLNVSFIISSVVAPSLRLTLKTQFLLSSTFFTLAYLSGVPACLTDIVSLKFVIMCLGTSLLGISIGCFFVSQGRYVHLVCQKLGVESKKGEMYGIVGGFYCMSNVSAGLITTFGLGFFSPPIYFCILGALGSIALAFCYLFVRDISQLHPLAQDEGFLSPQTSPIDEQAEAEHYNIWGSIVQTISEIPKMYAILTMLMLDGLAYGVFSSEIVKLVPEDVEEDMVYRMAGLTMISLGVGSVFGGYLCGVSSDKFGTFQSGKMSLALWIISCGAFVIAISWPSIWLAQIASFLWGFSMYFLEGWISIAISVNYQGLPEAFSVNKQFNAFFFIVSQIAVFATDNVLPLVPLMIGLATLSIPAYLLLMKMPRVDVPEKRQTMESKQQSFDI